MSQNEQSKILTIEEQIKKLKEKKKREVEKLERNTGKRLIAKLNLETKSLEEIYDIIDFIAENYSNINQVASSEESDVESNN